MIKRISLSTLSAVVLFAFGAVAHAQLLVYELSLSKTGRSVNYTFFQGGYLLVDTAASTFSSVIVLSDPNTFFFYQAPSLISGSYNTMLDYTGNQHAVLFGASAGASTSDSGALQVIGDLDRYSSVGGGKHSQLSKKLTGYFLASGPQGNATTTNGTTSSFEYGYAGASKATAEYKSDLTKQVNNDKLASADALSYLQTLLTNRGIPGPTPTPSPTP
jgi:hypothetical protein